MKRELTNQELLDRYIHSIKSMLPPDQMDDIAAEIGSNLQSLMEDEADQRGRDLTLQELSAILQQYGHPVLIARRYHHEPRPALIGPDLFPFYWVTLRSILGLVFTILTVIAVFNVFQQPNPGEFLLRFSRNVLLAEFVVAAVITLGFAAWEFMEFKYKFSERWKPESLPPVPPPVRVKRRRALYPTLQMIVSILWLAFLCTQLSAVFSPWFWGGKGTFVPSPALYAMRLPLLLLSLAWVSQFWLTHTRYAAAEWRPLLRVALNLAGLAWALFLLHSGDLLVAGPRWNPNYGHSVDLLNRTFAGLLLISCISSTLRCLFELRGLARRMGKGSHPVASISK